MVVCALLWRRASSAKSLSSTPPAAEVGGRHVRHPRAGRTDRGCNGGPRGRRNARRETRAARAMGGRRAWSLAFLACLVLGIGNATLASTVEALVESANTPLHSFTFLSLTPRVATCHH